MDGYTAPAILHSPTRTIDSKTENGFQGINSAESPSMLEFRLHSSDVGGRMILIDASGYIRHQLGTQQSHEMEAK